jgi:hypothetical protein
MTKASDTLAKALANALAASHSMAARPGPLTEEIVDITVRHLGAALDGYAEEVARRGGRCAVHDLPVDSARLTA